MNVVEVLQSLDVNDVGRWPAAFRGAVIAIVFIFILFFSLVKRYKRCPSDRILVVYGKVGKGTGGSRSSKTTLK